MATDKELRAELDRFFLSTLFQTLPAVSSKKESEVREFIAKSLHFDVSTINNFLAGRSDSLSADTWKDFPTDKFKYQGKIMYKGKGPKEFVKLFNGASKIRYMLLPFNFVISDKSDAPELIKNIVEWSVKAINVFWDEADGALDVKYWVKIINLFP